MFKDILYRVRQQHGGMGAEVASPTDALSLLYVTGLHRGVKPDCEMALGMMPVSSIGALRDLLGTCLPHRETAAILGIIEATAHAIRSGDVAGISYSEYAELAEEIARDLEDAETHSGVSWPAPADELRRRLGQGFWDTALGSVGLQLPPTRSL